jgi:hypothetical protein
LWLGCMGGYDPKGREIVADFARVMNYLGTSYGVLRKEKCTGDPVRRLGNDLLFQQLAEANLEALAQNKVKKIVSICPHCVRTIQEDWKEYGTPPEVEHHSEFLARFADKAPVGGTGSFPPHEATPSEGALAPEARPTRYDRLPRSLLSGPLSQRLRRAAHSSRRWPATWSKPRATASAASAAEPAAGSPSSAKRPASASATTRRGTGRHRRADHRHSLPLLQHHVPRCAGSHRRRRAATARHCPIDRARIAGATASKLR